MANKRESFSLLNRELRVTTDASGNRTIQGQIPYNSASSGLPWTESISPGAFSESLKTGAEVLLLRNHDVGQLYGNTQAGTLVLSDSADGLNFRCQLPNTTQAADLIESISRKDLAGVSFGFVCSSDRWQDDGKGNLTRSLDAVTLFEISLCNWAAFPSAGFSLRSVPREFRPLVKRSHSDGCECDCEACNEGDCESCDMDGCDDEACLANGCAEQESDGDEENEDRSTRLNWVERTLLNIEVLRRK